MYLQCNVGALSIHDGVLERGTEGWIEDPHGLYTHVEQATHVMRGMFIEEVKRTIQHPSMTSRGYAHRPRKDSS